MDGDGGLNHGPVTIADESRSAPPLEAEIQTAQAAFKTALLQLGLLSRFQRDVRTLGVQDYASKPPSHMTNALMQALKAYNEACDSMEAQIMRARAALLYDPAAEKATPTHDHQQSEATQAKKDEAGDESMDVEPREEQMLVPSLPEDMLLQQKAEAKPESSSVLNDAEMEDLFGPATAKTDLSMISTPANTSSQQLPTETSRIAETEKDVSLPSAPTDAAVYGPNAQPQDGANSGVEAHAPVSAVSGSQPPDPTASLFDFSSIDTNTLNSASSLPENNFDFSHMTTDDFNSLLASLGASGGGSGSTGTNLLEGLDLSTDLSSFLNTDINPNP